MALSKSVTLDNGVTVDYWRIVAIQTVTNVQHSIEVAGYIDSTGREAEKSAREENKPVTCFIHEEFFVAPYSESFDVPAAYNWLKQQEFFAGSIDVLEEGQDAD